MRQYFLSLMIICQGLGGFWACSKAEEGPAVPLTDAELAAVTAEETSPIENQTPSKYPDLPRAFQEGLAVCEAKNQYYDLTLASCTETTLAAFPCVLDQLLSAESTVLSEQLKNKLRDYYAGNLEGFKLFACTETTEAFDLHFYKPGDDKVRSYNVKLVKATP